MTVEVPALFQLWTVEKLTTSEIARRLKATEGTIQGQLRRLRRVEGEDRWPSRGNPAIRKEKRHIKRAGASTLPPLASLKA